MVLGINFNFTAAGHLFKVITRPPILLPHVTVSTFNDLPVPLSVVLDSEGRKADIRAVVLDKDDCFAYPETNEIYEPYRAKFAALREAYPGRRLVIVSNTAGARSWDRDLKLAAELEASTGVVVLPHGAKKPGCGDEIMEYFRKHPETGVTNPAQVAIVGDRLMTDIMMANMMGSWGFWVKDGVVPLSEKIAFARMERKWAASLMARGYKPNDPISPFE